MILEVRLNDQAGEILEHLVLTANRPDLTAEQYAAVLLSQLLNQLWTEYSNKSHILN